jgi:hypothetical protein
MSRRGKDWLSFVMVLAGVGCIVAGVAAVYPPAGLITFGMLVLFVDYLRGDDA